MLRFRSTTRPGGFALIAALLMTAATVAIAVGLYVAASGARAGAVHTASGEFAEVIAKAGMERSEAWALKMTSGLTDFDRVLDPNLANSPSDGEAVCTTLDAVTDNGVVPEVGNMNLPLFTDGARIQYPTGTGKFYRRVPYQGGAYLVRFDDNDDDTINAPFGGTPDWSTRTTNNLDGVALCAEGPAATPAGTLGVENKARDRDRVIWATVIGIYPGTDPDKAIHRAVLRKMLIDNRIVGPAAMQVRGNIDVNSGAEAELCSQVSGVTSGGFIDSDPPGSCGCGSVTADSVSLLDGQCTGCCGDNTLDTNPEPTTVPAIPTYTDAKWYDWSSSCTFFIEPGEPSPGLYFWDPTALRGPTGTCGTYTGGLVVPDVTAGSAGSCWVPIVKVVSGVTTVYISELSASVPATQEVFPSATGGELVNWQPRNSVVAYNIGSTAVSPSQNYFGALNGAGIKPNWALCPSTVATQFKWNPQSTGTGNGTETPNCTTCDGSRKMWTLNTAAPRWKLHEGNYPAMPTATYVYNGTYTPTWTGAFPTALNPATSWPMITLVVAQNLVVSGGNRLWLGVGTRKNEFPSVIVGGNLEVESGSRFSAAGSTYVNGDFNIAAGGSNGAYLFGKVSVNGDLEVSGGGRLNWDYDVDLDALTVVPPPVPRLSTPIPF
jgi:hypothetical protein